ncbi:DUF1330 domain-containing protein [Parasphingorhabdus halotolerans]|uniref:DUF1330 domain-containing protein n=1 Tax=Parasphingorhabdus halotolerans TaxID=2725558 RepID=A0A6H2DMD6_9SPHN|nr:DUF1330 domain-containing protein [Parasphingorhabdus halotolerans]QJB69514.1 DUF1330 domain-containing protein [Parasphingorhabdus halotolerans]
MKVVNQVNPSPEAMTEFFGAEEEGPFVMVNLLKFKDKAEYADGSDADLSGAEAYARYGAAVGKCIADVGGKPGFAGPVTGLMLGEVEENWDMVALVEYPSLEAMKKMVSSPEYQKITIHRTAGLAGQLNIKTKASKSDG